MDVSVVYVESNRMSQRKKTVIDMLRASNGFVSGEVMSDSLGISRNAIHKHVKSLRNRGYNILGVSRRGYKLEEEPNRLSMARITDSMEGSSLGRSFRYYDEIESTNAEAKSLANSGAPEGTVVIAECQSAGRGRLGRRWTSPAGKGLLFSVVLRPSVPMSQAYLLTLVAAAAAAEGIEAAAAVRLQIKWPNDLFIGDRKVGGILMEVAGEQDEVEWVVVGIGVNVNTEYGELPVALRRTATSLKMITGQPVDRSDLLCHLLVALEKHYADAVNKGFDGALSAFRARDYLLRRSVSVQTHEGQVTGQASGIDERGALLVEMGQRQIRRFHSGDVSLHR
jgi:BirA family transcriptional regulator, biotin operon repressor / biotin---[acetyl-CoA-carboxylase] ligase